MRGVIIDYTNVVEAEIKAKLLPGLDDFLMEKGTTLNNIEPNEMLRGGSSLGYTELVLNRIAENPILTNLFSVLPKDTTSFLFDKLPGSLSEVRKLRNAAAHGDSVGSKDAKEIRRLLHGTQGKAGLLERLSKITLG